MFKQNFKSLHFIMFAAIPLLFLINCEEESRTLPNIVLIMADDMGYSDLGCYGSEIETPNLDKLAYNGLRFTQFYNAARCCPTRASLLTGLYPHQAGMGHMISHEGMPKFPASYQGFLNSSCVTIAEVLKSAGYTTLMSGKWHVGEYHPHWPCDRGFDRYYGLISGAANYFDVTKSRYPGLVRQMAIDNEAIPLPTKNFYMTDAITDHAVKMIETYGKQDKPIFQYIAYTAPHWPLHAMPDDIAKYEDTYLDGWDELRKQRYQKMLEMGIIDKNWQLSPRDKDAIAWDEVEDKALMARKMAVYAAQIDRMDQGVGRIVDALKRNGAFENTLLFFLSDNGACAEFLPLGYDYWDNGAQPGGPDSYQTYGASWSNASNTPFRRHKQYIHEGGISTPLIVHWPKGLAKSGTMTTQVGHIIDIMATCVDVAGATYPHTYRDHTILPMEGKSLLPIIKGNEREPHEYLYWEHEKNRGIRHGQWKLVSSNLAYWDLPEDKKWRLANMEFGPWELYDIEADRTELNDLSSKHPEIVARLKAEYHSWVKKVGVKDN